MPLCVFAPWWFKKTCTPGTPTLVTRFCDFIPHKERLRIFLIHSNPDTNCMRYHHILHIDDDEDDQEIFRIALDRVAADTGYTPMTSAGDALDALKQGSVVSDLIFLDLNMPLMDGRQFLRELKAVEPLSGIPVIVLSTASYTAARVEMMSMGAHDFQTKPADFNEMIQFLNRILTT